MRGNTENAFSLSCACGIFCWSSHLPLSHVFVLPPLRYLSLSAYLSSISLHVSLSLLPPSLLPLAPPSLSACLSLSPLSPLSSPQFDFRPSVGSPLIGKGVSHPPQVPQVPQIPPSNGAVGGSSIDVGAYQSGEPQWVAGCTFNAGC